MSIEKEYGLYIPTCDICGETLPRMQDFYNAVNSKKEAGWNSKKENWDWVDMCNECFAKEIGT